VLAALAFVGLACAPAARRGPTANDAVAELAALRQRASASCLHRRPGLLPPRPFTTDACTWWPDGDWSACCIEHDMAYWCGGTTEARRAADTALRACIGRDHGATLSTLTYLGVRVGGAAWMPVPWRWGYGWEWLDAPP